jgi:hypothetical protein
MLIRYFDDIDSQGGTLIELIVLTPDGPPLGVATSLHIHDLPWIDLDSPVSGTA